MVAIVERLLASGLAYQTRRGVYLDCRADGKEALGNHGTGTEDPDRRHAADFALWRVDGTHRSPVRFDSPWGEGQPGMHLPCVAACRSVFGGHVDVHTGTENHRHLHHVNETRIVEALGEPTRRWVSAWLRVGFVGSGSGLLTRRQALLLSELAERGFTPPVVRLLMLQSRYGGAMTLDEETLTAARSAFHRLQGRLSRCELSEVPDVTTFSQARDLLDGDRRGLALLEQIIGQARGDLATPSTLASLSRIVRSGDLTPTSRAVLVEVAERISGIRIRPEWGSW